MSHSLLGQLNKVPTSCRFLLQKIENFIIGGLTKSGEVGKCFKKNKQRDAYSGSKSTHLYPWVEGGIICFSTLPNSATPRHRIVGGGGG